MWLPGLQVHNGLGSGVGDSRTDRLALEQWTEMACKMLDPTNLAVKTSLRADSSSAAGRALTGAPALLGGATSAPTAKIAAAAAEGDTGSSVRRASPQGTTDVLGMAIGIGTHAGQVGTSKQPKVFVLPLQRSEETIMPGQQHIDEAWHRQMRAFRASLLQMSKRQLGRSMKEREWLRAAARVWEAVLRSPFISEYCRTLASMRQAT